MPSQEEYRHFKSAVYSVGREVGENLIPNLVGALTPTAEARLFHNEVAALLSQIVMRHELAEQVALISGIKSIRPEVSKTAEKKYIPYRFFGMIAAESAIGGVPPRAFYWVETIVKSTSTSVVRKKEKHLTEVWPLQPSVYEEDVEAAVAEQKLGSANHVIANFTLSSTTPESLEEDYGIIALEANDIEVGAHAYVAIPRSRDGGEVLWRLGVLGDYLIDPGVAAEMNEAFEDGMKRLEAQYL